MKKHQVATMQPAREAAPMRLLPGSKLFDGIQDLSNSIARRAFEIFEEGWSAGTLDAEGYQGAEGPGGRKAGVRFQVGGACLGQSISAKVCTYKCEGEKP